MAGDPLREVKEVYAAIKKDFHEFFGSTFIKGVKRASERLATLNPAYGEHVYKEILDRFGFSVEPLENNLLVKIDEHRGNFLLNLHHVKDLLPGNKYSLSPAEQKIAERIRHKLTEIVAYEIERWWCFKRSGSSTHQGQQNGLVADALQLPEGTQNGLELAFILTFIFMLLIAGINVASLTQQKVMGMAVATPSSMLGATLLFLAVVLGVYAMKKE